LAVLAELGVSCDMRDTPWAKHDRMMNNPTIRFIEEHLFDEVSIRSVRGLAGLYFIHTFDLTIPYPFRSSRLIYVGMSESKQNSIGNRIRDHESGKSGNPGLTNYIRTRKAQFSYFTFDFLDVLGIPTIAELEGAFLRAFLKDHGSYPICNNQSGIELKTQIVVPPFEIDWQYFI
jgi:hypothetical protein